MPANSQPPSKAPLKSEPDPSQPSVSKQVRYERIRKLYEAGVLPNTVLADMVGISLSSLRYHITQYGWSIGRRNDERVHREPEHERNASEAAAAPVQKPSPADPLDAHVANEGTEQTAPSAPPSLDARLYDAIARKFTAMEAQLSSPAETFSEDEQHLRILTTLVRSIEKLTPNDANAHAKAARGGSTDTQHDAQHAGSHTNDRRFALARRLTQILENEISKTNAEHDL